MLKGNEDATGATGAGKHEGRAAVRHSKIPEPELNQEDAAADSTQTVDARESATHGNARARAAGTGSNEDATDARGKAGQQASHRRQVGSNHQKQAGSKQGGGCERNQGSRYARGREAKGQL